MSSEMVFPGKGISSDLRKQIDGIIDERMRLYEEEIIDMLVGTSGLMGTDWQGLEALLGEEEE